MGRGGGGATPRWLERGDPNIIIPTSGQGSIISEDTGIKRTDIFKKGERKCCFRKTISSGGGGKTVRLSVKRREEEKEFLQEKRAKKEQRAPKSAHGSDSREKKRKGKR